MRRVQWDDTKLGQGDSYSLDYGAAFTGCGCITEIRTSVERFRTAAIAKKRLAFWKRGDEQVLSLDVEPGLVVDVHRFVNAPPVGTRRFAYFTEYRAARARRARVVDERFTDGRYVFQVEVHWGAGASGITVARKLGKKLDRRLHLALAGRLHATPAKLPQPSVPGPPPGGPDLSRLILQPGDLPPAAIGGDGSYFWDPFTPSHYRASYGWAAHRALYQSLTQDVEWYTTVNAAAFWSAYQEAWLVVSDQEGWPRDRTQIRSIRVREGRATIMWFPGGSGSFAFIALARGHVADGLTVRSNKTQLPASDVEALARAMAARLDAAVSG